MTPEKKKNIKEKVVDEIYLMLAYTIFFTLVFFAIALYTSLILGEYGISYFHFGYSIIEALILAKVILIGQHFRLGERYTDCPLIIPTLYKSVIFTLFVFAFSVLEHFVKGIWEGRPFKEVYESFYTLNIDAILARALVLFFVFILFFAFTETARVIGMDKLANLFLGKQKNKG